MEETNEMEFQKQLEEMISRMMEDAKKSLAQLKAEEDSTVIFEGKYGKYLIHLN